MMSVCCVTWHYSCLCFHLTITVIRPLVITTVTLQLNDCHSGILPAYCICLFPEYWMIVNIAMWSTASTSFIAMTLFAVILSYLFGVEKVHTHFRDPGADKSTGRCSFTGSFCHRNINIQYDYCISPLLRCHGYYRVHFK